MGNKMDWVTVAIGLGVCFITAVVLYLISVYSFKEHTFEEALAEQQKFANSLLKGEKGNAKEKEKPRNPSRKLRTRKRKMLTLPLQHLVLLLKGNPMLSLSLRKKSSLKNLYLLRQKL